VGDGDGDDGVGDGDVDIEGEGEEMMTSVGDVLDDAGGYDVTGLEFE
jgi:hypothetical protein